jgi:hypothetical protein
MKIHNALLWLLAPLLLAGCASVAPSDWTAPAPGASQPSAAESLSSDTPFTLENLTCRETISLFFELQYEAYAGLQYIDISRLVDTETVRNRNMLLWTRGLCQRRRLIEAYGLCPVDTVLHPYEIVYEDNAEDDRMEFWSRRSDIPEDEVTVHFRIRGESGVAYPPIMALNAQHTMRLRPLSTGGWQITFHYFPGSVRRFSQHETLAVPSEEDMLESLLVEFALQPEAEGTAPSGGVLMYDGSAAAAYAAVHTDRSNEQFYRIGDWMGNCANFISQCVWAGFGGEEGADPMTYDWFAGQGGGSPAWENVEYFWSYAVKAKTAAARGMHGRTAEGILGLTAGGVIQLRTGAMRTDEDTRYNHSLILADTERLLLAQNSPDCLISYADLYNVEARFYQPLYMVP